jgi:tetratricopeptide (TPR) repeat protein
MGRFVLGREYLERAATLLRAHPESEEDLSYVLGMLGSAYVYFGEFERAERLTRESIELGEKIGHQTRISQGQFYLGIVYVVQGRWAEARRIFDTALEIARRERNVIGTATGSSFLGMTYLADGNALRAVELCTFGRNHIASTGATVTLSMIGSHLAEALLANDQPESALEVARETQRVIDAGERWGEAWLYIAMGRIYARIGDVEAALRSFDRANEAAEAQKNVVFAALSRLAKGAFLLQRGDTSSAKPLLEHALAEFVKMGMPWYADRSRSLLEGKLYRGVYPG